MKQYKSHKIVEAAPIHMAAVDDEGGCHVYLEPHGEHFAMPDGAFARGMPIRGDYLVRYQPDGYLSWSPKAVFEAGYTLVEPGASSWQESAVAEMDELAGRIEKLRTFLIGGPKLDAQVLGLMQAQYAGMCSYYDALVARLRLTGAVSVETPPLVREERGTSAAVEVTVTAPAGKRAHVSIGSMGRSARSSWTVTEGQQQTWSVAQGEFVTVHEGQPHSTVAETPGSV